jgi:hypothetical protein
MEHGHAGGNLHAEAGNCSAGGQATEPLVAVRPGHIAGCQGVLTRLSHFEVGARWSHGRSRPGDPAGGSSRDTAGSHSSLALRLPKGCST